jgi:hypothetical protein
MAAAAAEAAAPSAARHNVNFITGNANKLTEVQAILEPAIRVSSQALDLVEIQGTLEEVTLDKCRRAAELVRLPVSPPPCSGCGLTRRPPCRSRAPCSSRTHA